MEQRKGVECRQRFLNSLKTKLNLTKLLCS